MKTSLILLVNLFLVVESQVPKFSPYVYPGTDLVSLYNTHNLRAATVAFVLSNGGCTPNWNGWLAINDPWAINQINAFRNLGGKWWLLLEVPQIPTKSCKNPNDLANAYKTVLIATGSTNLDLDIEEYSYPNYQNSYHIIMQAVKIVQTWNPSVTFTLTAMADQNGLVQQGIDLLAYAWAYTVRVDIINAMTMNFDTSGQALGVAVPAVAEKIKTQLKNLYAGTNYRQTDQLIYANIGLTVMIGQQDCCSGPLTPTDAQQIVAYAKSKGIGYLSYWQLSRDNGGCPTQTSSSGTCSGLSQSNYQFLVIFSQFN